MPRQNPRSKPRGSWTKEGLGMAATSDPGGSLERENQGAGEMPSATMGDPGLSEMPSGVMDRAPETEMPAGTMQSMAEGRAGGEMPSGRMNEGAGGGSTNGLSGTDDGAPRFPPAGS